MNWFLKNIKRAKARAIFIGLAILIIINVNLSGFFAFTENERRGCEVIKYVFSFTDKDKRSEVYKNLSDDNKILFKRYIPQYSINNNCVTKEKLISRIALILFFGFLIILIKREHIPWFRRRVNKSIDDQSITSENKKENFKWESREQSAFCKKSKDEGEHITIDNNFKLKRYDLFYNIAVSLFFISVIELATKIIFKDFGFNGTGIITYSLAVFISFLFSNETVRTILISIMLFFVKTSGIWIIAVIYLRMKINKIKNPNYKPSKILLVVYWGISLLFIIGMLVGIIAVLFDL